MSFIIIKSQADKLISQEIHKSYQTICVTINENISFVIGINYILHNIVNGYPLLVVRRMCKKVFGFWPIPFLINMLTALKGSQFYFLLLLQLVLCLEAALKRFTSIIHSADYIFHLVL